MATTPRAIRAHPPKRLAFICVSLLVIGSFCIAAKAQDFVYQPLFTRVETTPSDTPSSPPPRPLTDAMATRSDVQRFIKQMAAQHGFSEAQLTAMFSQIVSRNDIIAKITRPAEKTKPWRDYRKIFLDEPRIQGGVEFWRAHAKTLERAEQIHGVPAEIIIAILGVETRYGRITGNDGVLEALSTLAFDYPKRAPFFRSELEHYLLLTREEAIDPLTLSGSYAGAMGLAQFMPSSYRAYAVDFDSDGHRDLWRNPTDAIGSVANYLSRHGWRRNQAIVVPATVQGQAYQSLLSQDLKPKYSVAELRRRAIIPQTPADDTKPAILLELLGDNGLEYWLGFDNFYVITRYNHSPLYAMAVYQLSQAIRRRYAG